MIMIKLRMFSYSFAYTRMSDILIKGIKTKLLFNEKSTNYKQDIFLLKLNNYKIKYNKFKYKF